MTIVETSVKQNNIIPISFECSPFRRVCLVAYGVYRDLQECLRGDVSLQDLIFRLQVANCRLHDLDLVLQLLNLAPDSVHQV